MIIFIFANEIGNLKMENEKEYLEPSNATRSYLSHVEQMNQTKSQPVGKSFSIAQEGFHFTLLLDICKSINSSTKKSFVVIRWPDAYEIQRLPDGVDVDLFYKHTKKDNTPNSKPENEIKMNKIMNICNEFLSSEKLEFKKYDQNLTTEMKNERIISSAILQRRTACVSIFRKDANGANNALKQTIKELIKTGFLKEMPREFALSNYKTTAKLYKIVGITEKGEIK